jgi:hypothetical protein
MFVVLCKIMFIVKLKFNETQIIFFREERKKSSLLLDHNCSSMCTVSASP